MKNVAYMNIHSFGRLEVQSSHSEFSQEIERENRNLVLSRNSMLYLKICFLFKFAYIITSCVHCVCVYAIGMFLCHLLKRLFWLVWYFIRYSYSYVMYVFRLPMPLPLLLPLPLRSIQFSSVELNTGVSLSVATLYVCVKKFQLKDWAACVFFSFLSLRSTTELNI